MNKNMKNRCRITERIALLVDNELPAGDADAVRRHMTDCEFCRQEYASLMSVDQLLRGMAPVAASDEFARNFWKKADAADASKARWQVFNPLASWGWRSSLVSAAATALILIAAGTLYYRQALNHSPPVASTAVSEDMLIAEDMALYENYEIIRHLDLFEHWDEINSTNEI